VAVLRVFIGVDLPYEIKEALELIGKKVASRHRSARVIAARNIHLTLKFLGSFDGSMIELLAERIAKNVAGQPCFDIVFDDLGGFPRNNYARVFWIGVGEGAEKVKILAKAVERAAKTFGYPPEKRSFQAHLTLVRFKKPQDIKETLSLPYKIPQAEVRIDGVTIFESKLLPQGAEYKPLKVIKLSQKK
jgi:2'-5' RNA ligase